MNEAILRQYRDSQQLEQIDAHLGGLGEDALRDLARNESARPAFRKEAVKRLVAVGSRHVNHPDLAVMVEQLKAESPVEKAVEKEEVSAVDSPESEPSVFNTSVKVDSLLQDEVG